MIETRLAIILCTILSIVSFFAGRSSGFAIDDPRIAALTEVAESQTAAVEKLMAANAELSDSLYRSRQTVDLANETISTLESSLAVANDAMREVALQAKLQQIDYELAIKKLQAAVDFAEAKNVILADSVEFYRAERDRVFAKVGEGTL